MTTSTNPFSDNYHPNKDPKHVTSFCLSRCFSGAVRLTLAVALVCLSRYAWALELIEPPALVEQGSTGDAATNEGHAVSADGRYVVFTSYASNLVANDQNGARDVFLWDTSLDTVVLVSRSAQGEQANADCADAVISADGQWVAFSSAADNLTLDENGAVEDVFLYSRVSGSIALVSISTSGGQSQAAALRPDINANGRYVTFDTTGNLAEGSDDAQNQVFRRDTWANTTALISQTPEGVVGNGLSMDAQMSANGQRVVFVSMATNLVSTVTVGKESFLRDLSANTISLLSLNAAGEAGDGISYFPSISGDGNFAAFHTNASNLVAGDRAEVTDVVLRNIATGELELLSRTAAGTAANDYNIHPSLSFDGQRVAFATNATNLVDTDAPTHVDVVLVDRGDRSISLVSEISGAPVANGDSGSPSISYDGRSVAYSTRADNLSASGTLFSDVLLGVEQDSEPQAVALAAAILPSSRSVQLGAPLTAFASVIGTGLAGDCIVELAAPFGSSMGGSEIDLEFQTTNPATNAAVGAANSPFLLLPDVPQTLLLTLTPSVQLSAQELEFVFACTPGTAPITPGTNTLLVSADSTQPEDIVALVATLDNNGIVSLPAGGGAGFFSVASVNVGSSGSIRARPIAQGTPLDGVSICQTNPVTGACLAQAGTEVTLAIESGATPTFAVFLSHSEDVSFAPAENRLVVQFEDAGGVVRGRTSVAVRTLAVGN